MKRLIAGIVFIGIILCGCAGGESTPEAGEINSEIRVTVDDYLCGGKLFYSGGIFKFSLELSGNELVLCEQDGKATVSYLGLERELESSDAVKIISALKTILSSLNKAERNTDGDFVLSGTADELVYKAVWDENGNPIGIEIPTLDMKITFIN